MPVFPVHFSAARARFTLDAGAATLFPGGLPVCAATVAFWGAGAPLKAGRSAQKAGGAPAQSGE
jgi:hypothetical protein